MKVLLLFYSAVEDLYSIETLFTKLAVLVFIAIMMFGFIPQQKSNLEPEVINHSHQNEYIFFSFLF